MKAVLGVSLVVAMAVLTACAPSRQQYDVVQTALEGSPAYRAKSLSICLSQNWSDKALQEAALLMSVPKPKAKKLVCSRITSALSSGRLTHDDVKAIYRGQPTPNVIKILQGR